MEFEFELTGGDGEADVLSVPALCTAGVGIDVDEPGLIAGIVVDYEASEPYIENGELHLLPGTGLTEVVYTMGISKPEITGGVVRHPFARSQNGSSVSGVIGGLEVTSSVNAPEISERGIIRLPLADKAGRTGLISGLRISSVLAPELKNGEICLPLQSMTIGVIDGNGNQRRWEDLSGYQYETEVARVAIPGLGGGDVSSPAAGIALSVFQVGGFVKFNLYTYT